MSLQLSGRLSQPTQHRSNTDSEQNRRWIYVYGYDDPMWWTSGREHIRRGRWIYNEQFHPLELFNWTPGMRRTPPRTPRRCRGGRGGRGGRRHRRHRQIAQGVAGGSTTGQAGASAQNVPVTTHRSVDWYGLYREVAGLLRLPRDEHGLSKHFTLPRIHTGTDLWQRF